MKMIKSDKFPEEKIDYRKMVLQKNLLKRISKELSGVDLNISSDKVQKEKLLEILHKRETELACINKKPTNISKNSGRYVIIPPDHKNRPPIYTSNAATNKKKIEERFFIRKTSKIGAAKKTAWRRPDYKVVFNAFNSS